MGENVRIKMTGQPEQLLAKYDAVIRKQGQVINQLRKAGRESKESGKKASTSIGGWARSLIDLAAGYASVGAAIKAVTTELDAAREAGRRASEAIQKVQESRASAAFSFPLNIPRREFESFVRDTAQQVGVTAQPALQLAAQVGSASAGASPEQIKGAVELALELSAKSSQFEAATLGGAVLDTLKATGLTDPQVALGFLGKIGTQVRIPNLSQTAKTAPRALAVGTGVAGIRPEETAALFALLTQKTVDTTGETAATGVVAATEALFGRKTVPTFDAAKQKLSFDFLSNVNPELAESGGLFETLKFFRERIAGLPPEFRSEAVGKVSFGKGAVRSAFRGLVTGNEQTLAQLAPIRAALTAPGPKDVAFVNEVLQFIGEGGIGAGLTAARKTTAASQEQLQLGNPREALRRSLLQAERGLVSDLPSTLRPFRATRAIAEIGQEFASSETILGQIQTRRDIFQSILSGLDSGTLLRRVDDPTRDELLAIIRSFSDVIDKFQPLVKAMRENTEALRNNTAGTVGPFAPPALLDTQGGEQ
ncbi:MAG: phage tail tape measure protein [Phycisphaerae bacterium]